MSIIKILSAETSTTMSFKGIIYFLSWGLCFISPASAQSFEQLADQYRSYDIQCQNSGANCWARDQVGEKLSLMGAYLCGRRDWYVTPQEASAAGCR